MLAETSVPARAGGSASARCSCCCPGTSATRPTPGSSPARSRSSSSTATLYHDDVIDEADARHGVPSANVRWDNTVAILTGDYLFARASEISTDLGTDICALLARTIATLCDGQIREVEAAGRVDQTESAHLEVIRRKTGALIATSCRLGGMLSDAPARRRTSSRSSAGRSASPSSSPTTSWTSPRARRPRQGARRDLRGACTRSRCSTRSAGRGTDELAASGRRSAVGERLDRALEIVRAPDDLAHARAAVAGEVDRARMLADRLPAGPARALVQLAEFLAVRCGAREENGGMSPC